MFYKHMTCEEMISCVVVDANEFAKYQTWHFPSSCMISAKRSMSVF